MQRNERLKFKLNEWGKNESMNKEKCKKKGKKLQKKDRVNVENIVNFY